MRIGLVIIGLALLLLGGPLRGEARADLTCRQACKQAQDRCVQQCSSHPRAGVCKRACRHPRVRRACIRLCKQGGGAGAPAEQ